MLTRLPKIIFYSVAVVAIVEGGIVCVNLASSVVLGAQRGPLKLTKAIGYCCCAGATANFARSSANHSLRSRIRIAWLSRFFCSLTIAAYTNFGLLELLDEL